MDAFDQGILGFWRSLQDSGVRYIMVGGYATNLHGYQRYTADLDIWIEDTPENRRRLRSAFKDAEMGDFPMIERMQFVPGWTEFYLNNGLRLDLMVDMKGIQEYSFEECLQAASVADIDGVKIPFLHIDQLIQNKEAVNRPKDQLDVIALKQIRQLKKGQD